MKIKVFVFCISTSDFNFTAKSTVKVSLEWRDCDFVKVALNLSVNNLCLSTVSFLYFV